MKHVAEAAVLNMSKTCSKHVMNAISELLPEPNEATHRVCNDHKPYHCMHSRNTVVECLLQGSVTAPAQAMDSPPKWSWAASSRQESAPIAR
eukprot:5443880-Amphidinium_carterae.2